jgi:hypothetical protein
VKPKEIYVYTDRSEEELDVIDIAGEAIEMGAWEATRLAALRAVDEMSEKENYRIFKLSIEQVPAEEVTAYIQSAVEPRE